MGKLMLPRPPLLRGVFTNAKWLNLLSMEQPISWGGTRVVDGVRDGVDSKRRPRTQSVSCGVAEKEAGTHRGVDGVELLRRVREGDDLRLWQCAWHASAAVPFSPWTESQTGQSTFRCFRSPPLARLGTEPRTGHTNVKSSG